MIVISANERLIARPHGSILTSSPYFTTEEYDYYFIDQPIYDDIPYEPSGTTAHCERDDRMGKEEIVSFKFTSDRDLDAAESWLMGAPELFVRVFLIKPTGAIDPLDLTLSKVDRSKYKNCGLFSCKTTARSVNMEVVTWDFALYGTSMKYMWYEHDDGDPITVKTSFSTSFKDDSGITTTVGGEISYTITQKDHFITSAMVEYCDDADGYTYGVNSPAEFVVRRKL